MNLSSLEPQLTASLKAGSKASLQPHTCRPLPERFHTGAVLGLGDAAVIKVNKIPSLLELTHGKG
jgi:hypothetical protein